MKKLMIIAGAVMLAASAHAGCRWSWWVGGDDSGKELKGCQLGIASECREMRGAQVSLLWNRSERVVGCQTAIGYNNAGKMIDGPQVGVVNIAREGAALQLGLLNFNPRGFLPFFPFFNFSTKYFGDHKTK